MAVFPGSSGTQEGEVLWSTKSRPVQGVFYMEIQDDGKLAIYKGTGPDVREGEQKKMKKKNSLKMMRKEKEKETKKMKTTLTTKKAHYKNKKSRMTKSFQKSLLGRTWSRSKR